MRICLSMIIKDERRVIERCLRSVMPFIHSWAIVDTGSSDGTQDIVREVMRDVPGELVERAWVDFATNRNQALELARAHGEYALIIDADEILEAEAGFAYPELKAPAYMLQLIFGNTRYRRVVIPRLDAQWKWEGVLHEVLVSPQAAAAEFLPGLSIRVFTDGARSQQTQEQKFTRDAEVLRKALDKEPGHTRYAFYLAQSLRDAGKTSEAVDAYAHRVAMGGWVEEVYYAKLQIAMLKERLGAPEGEILLAYLDAYNFRPTRAEAICEFARYNRLRERYTVARDAAQVAAGLAMPADVLFTDATVYEWRARDELSVSSYWCGDFALSARLCRELLADPRLPAEQHERVGKNLAFALERS
ncbi:MAG: glycosyltransferase [Rudaea sp.]